MDDHHLLLALRCLGDFSGKKNDGEEDFLRLFGICQGRSLTMEAVADEILFCLGGITIYLYFTPGSLANTSTTFADFSVLSATS